MFSNLLFLILTLFLIIQSPSAQESILFKDIWPVSSVEAIVFGLLLYAFTLFLISLQGYYWNKRRKKNPRSDFGCVLVNIELLAFLFLYYFLLGAHRLFFSLPIFSTFFEVLFSLMLYFGGFWIFHVFSRRLEIANKEIRFLIPFAIPFLVLILLFDLLNVLNIAQNPDSIDAILIFSTLFIIILLMIFLPFFMQLIWKCEPLPSSPLKSDLERICKIAHFRNAGLKTWSVFDHHLSAAIIGIVPSFRYIIFTKRLLNEMPPTSVEAILAHEIGHSYRKHLMIYPLIFLGLALLLELFSHYFSPWIAPLIDMQKTWEPAIFWHLLISFETVVPFLFIVALYIRFVFGLFSRLFERQADLHVFFLNVPSQYLIDGLNHIGIATGSTREPNWHHYSIQERIDFIQCAEKNPNLIRNHHLLVKLALGFYITFILIIIFLLLN